MNIKTKGAVRSKFDKKIIAEFFEEKGKMLRYLGLPGSKILDLIAWKPYLKSITGIEVNPEKASQMMHNIMLHGLEERFRRLIGDIDTIMISGEDLDGRKIIYPFELINLDYYGGLIHKDRRYISRRIDTLRHLFQNQEKCSKQEISFDSFLLFLTVNTRQNIVKEYEQFWDQIERHISNTDNKKTILWYKDKEEFFTSKVYVPDLIRKISSSTHYDCYTYSPLTYQGSSEIRMMHFVFKLRYIREIDTDIDPQQSFFEVFNLPLLEPRLVDGSKVEINDFAIQPPKLK